MSNPYDGLVPQTPETGETGMGKGLLRSKTFWTNALAAVVSIAVYFQDSELLVDKPEVVAGIGAGLGVLNIILRLLTKKPITGVK